MVQRSHWIFRPLDAPSIRTRCPPRSSFQGATLWRASINNALQLRNIKEYLALKTTIHIRELSCCYFNQPSQPLSTLLKRISQPPKSLIKSLSSRGTSSLNMPLTISNGRKRKLLHNLSWAHGIGQVLFVGKDQEDGVTELILVEHLHELFLGFLDTLTVIAVNDKDKTY